MLIIIIHLFVVQPYHSDYVGASDRYNVSLAYIYIYIYMSCHFSTVYTSLASAIDRVTSDVGVINRWTLCSCLHKCILPIAGVGQLLLSHLYLWKLYCMVL